jgi:hypothetical protein
MGLFNLPIPMRFAFGIVVSQKKPLEETHFLRGANEIRKCRLVFSLESIVLILGLSRVIFTTKTL